jgi:hypothetical protein
MKTVLLATFHELESARQLRGRLQQAGIQSVIHDESKLERFWFMSEPLAAFHLEVGRQDFAKARRLMEDWHESDGILQGAVRCPECNSARVEFPQVPRKFITPGLGSLLLALKILPREFYCFDCQYTWPLAVPVTRKRDILGWPYDSRLWHPEQARGPKRT